MKSRSREIVFRIVRSLWNLTGTSAALLPMCLSNFKAMRQFKVPISWLRVFTRSYEKTSFRILRRRSGDLYWKGPGSIHAFRFKETIVDDVMKYLSKLPDKSGDMLGFDRKLLRVAAPYISESLLYCQEVFSLRVFSWWLEICKVDTCV